MAKLWLHPDVLTSRDMRRAQEALSEILGERHPMDLLGTEDMFPLLIWCLKSRTDPDFTWDQALDTPFGEFELGDRDPEPPPPTAELTPDGPELGKHSGNGKRASPHSAVSTASA